MLENLLPILVVVGCFMIPILFLFAFFIVLFLKFILNVEERLTQLQSNIHQQIKEEFERRY